MEIDFNGLEESKLPDYYNVAPNILVGSQQELRFKLAAMKLVFTGIYPSGRQILKELGSERVEGRVNLNGRECRWKYDIFSIFKIEPFTGYMNRMYRYNYTGDFLLRRGPKGTLVEIK